MTNTLTRRQWFTTTASAAFASRHGASAELEKRDMITRSSRPMDLEMPLDGFLSPITPIERFYVRCHTYTPEVKLSEWKLSIDGVVDNPVTLTMDDLRKLPHVDLVGVIECAGNGRAFYQPRVAGTQWEYGSVGNARWVGVRLADVLRRAGVKDAARNVLFNGADVPLGKMEDFRRSIPLAKALDPDTLLAFAMNGRALPIVHGFPLRVVVPGWAGDSWAKWLEQITVLDKDFEGFWMKTAYRHPMKPVAPGTTVDPAQMIPVEDIGVKSVIASPGGWVQPGATTHIRGAAWSNTSPVAGVDVSTDGGATWKPAHLSKSLGRYSWRQWEAKWSAGPDGSKATLMARARNEAGQVQPLEQQWNPNGYLWNVVHRVEVAVAAKDPRTTTNKAKVEPNNTYASSCTACHAEGMSTQQRLTRAQWDKEVAKMERWGASVKPDERGQLLDYLLKLTGQ